MSSNKPSDQSGEWVITLKLEDNNPVPLHFKISYPGKQTMVVGTVYDPLDKSERTYRRGNVVEDSGGRKIQEFPSE